MAFILSKFKQSFLLPLVLVTVFANAQISLPTLVGNHMVLQRDKPLHIWGCAKPGEDVTLLFLGKMFTTITGADGKWSIRLPAQKQGGPYEMVLKASNTIKLNDIMIGDVWLCGGQSNMELKVSGALNAETEIANAVDLDIRSFAVQYQMSSTPLEDAKGNWVKCNPATVGNLSAVAFYFARDIYHQTKVPIGLIESYWGGTAIEAWLSPDKLANDPEFGKQLSVIKYINFDSLGTATTKNFYRWLSETEKMDSGYFNRSFEWSKQYHPEWPQLQLPGLFELSEKKFKGRDGVVWLTKSIELSAADIADTCFVFFGRINDDDLTFINGIKVGATQDGKFIARKYFVNRNILHEGMNYITIRVIDYGNPNYKPGFSNKADQFYFKTKSKVYSLAGSWNYKIGLDTVYKALHQKNVNPEHIPSVLYNAKIAPLTNFSVKGILWYQGEANATKAFQYRTLFKDLINSWRENFHDTSLPFLFVQLPLFQKESVTPVNSYWAELREAQSMALSLPHTAMAMTMDLGEEDNIHPKNKQDVSKRLALLARKYVNGEKKLSDEGPVFKKAVYKNNYCILYFKNTGKGLSVKNDSFLHAFQAETAGSKKFSFVSATIKGKNKIKIASPDGKPVTAVRYAWADNPGTLNLINSAGLLAYPFRTDSYKGLSYDRRYGANGE